MYRILRIHHGLPVYLGNDETFPHACFPGDRTRPDLFHAHPARHIDRPLFCGGEVFNVNAKRLFFYSRFYAHLFPGNIHPGDPTVASIDGSISLDI